MAAGFGVDSCNKEYLDASTWRTCPGGKSKRKDERPPFEENCNSKFRIGSFGFGGLYARCKYLRLLLIFLWRKIFQQATAWEPLFYFRLNRCEGVRPIAVIDIGKNLPWLSVRYAHPLSLICCHRRHIR